MFPLFLERMLYIPLTITSILLLNRIFRRTPQWFNRGFIFVGALSLEAYLIHIHFVLHYIEKYHWGVRRKMRLSSRMLVMVSGM